MDPFNDNVRVSMDSVIQCEISAINKRLQDNILLAHQLTKDRYQSPEVYTGPNADIFGEELCYTPEQPDLLHTLDTSPHSMHPNYGKSQLYDHTSNTV